jgi:hypothetical protein
MVSFTWNKPPISLSPTTPRQITIRDDRMKYEDQEHDVVPNEEALLKIFNSSTRSVQVQMVIDGLNILLMDSNHTQYMVVVLRLFNDVLSYAHFSVLSAMIETI